jgi:hypothetical protein
MRWSSFKRLLFLDCYLSSYSQTWPGYNDTKVNLPYNTSQRSHYETEETNTFRFECVEMVYDPEVYKDLVEGGVDELMAKHIAHLFIRFPLNRLTIPQGTGPNFSFSSSHSTMANHLSRLG